MATLLPSIPGLDILDRLRPDLPGLPKLEIDLGALPTGFGNLRGLLDRFNGDCPPRPNALLYSAELLAGLAAAEPALIKPN